MVAFAYYSCQNTKMIEKQFSSSSVVVLLEKVIRKNSEMLWYKTSMRKSFFSKVHAVQLKKNFSMSFFSWKFWKISRKKNTKTFREIINRACFDEYFYICILKVDKTYLQISFNQSFSKCSEKMPNVKSFGRYFSFCPCLIWRSHSCPISFCLFDGIWWKLKDWFFPERLTQPIAAQHGIMKITMNEVTEWLKK